jgi:hypothetical protein
MAEFAKRNDLTRKETRTLGFATFILYEGSNYSVEFLCGPPEYHVEILVELKKTNQKYDLTALTAIPTIQNWVLNHILTTNGEDKILAETKWYVDLIEFSLPILIEC